MYILLSLVEIEDGQAWDEAVNIINRSRATSKAVMSAATEFGRAIKGCKSQQSLAILLTRAGRQRYSTSRYWYERLRIDSSLHG